MHIKRFRVVPWILASCLLPCAVGAQDANMVVASDGAIHKLQQGLYHELFAGGHESDPESSVLALEVLRRGTVERFLVPTTQDAFAEIPAALYYEQRSSTTYVLWESLVNGLHPFLHLAGYNGAGQWTEPISIAGSVFADKGHAELLIVSEPEPAKTDLLQNASDRSIIYVVWQEITSLGSQKYLVPIILQDGTYLGWHDSLRLSWFDSTGSEGGIARSRQFVDPNVENLLQIQPSAKANTVVVGFTNPETGRLLTLELEMLPQALSALAARVEDIVRENAGTSRSVEELAKLLREALAEHGQDFHRSTIEHLMEEVERLLSEHPSVSSAAAPGVPEKFGLTIIHIGARMRAKGLIDSEPRQILQIGQTRGGGAPYHHLKVSILADRELPEVGGPAVLFLSSTGQEALVSWEVNGKIVFRETEDGAWGREQSIDLLEGMSKETVYRILADRALNR